MRANFSYMYKAILRHVNIRTEIYYEGFKRKITKFNWQCLIEKYPKIDRLAHYPANMVLTLSNN